jgi:hypothetical protein
VVGAELKSHRCLRRTLTPQQQYGAPLAQHGPPMPGYPGQLGHPMAYVPVSGAHGFSAGTSSGYWGDYWESPSAPC